MSLISKKTWCPGSGCTGTFRRLPEARYLGDPQGTPSAFFWIDKCDKCGYKKSTIKETGHAAYYAPANRKAR